jgi:transposase
LRPSAPGESLATDQSDDDAQMVMMPVARERQLMPGTLELAIHALVQRRRDTSIFDRIYRHDATGCPADDPTMLLKGMFCAYARGILASRTIAQACREHSTGMALACGLRPDHRTRAAVVASMTAASAAICGDMLLRGAEQHLFGGPHVS